MIPLSSLASLPNLGEAFDGEEIKTREQEWLKQRLGLFTGSEFHRLMSDGRINWKEEFLIQGERKNYTALINLDGEIIAESETLTTKASCTDFFAKWKSANAEHRLSVGAESYVLEKAGEILAEIELDGYTSAAMMWGKEYEPEAVQVFSERSGLNPYMTGDSQEFIKSTCGRYGVTPDGLIGDDEGLGACQDVAIQALGDAPLGIHRQWLLAVEDALGGQAEVDALGSGSVRRQGSGDHFARGRLAVGLLGPNDGQTIAARHQE